MKKIKKAFVVLGVFSVLSVGIVSGNYLHIDYSPLEHMDGI